MAKCRAILNKGHALRCFLPNSLTIRCVLGSDTNMTNSTINSPSIALFQPDIPQNTGTILRLGACLGLPIEVIEPCGFALSDRTLRRAGMDYLDSANLIRHMNFEAFDTQRRNQNRRLILMTTRAASPYTAFQFAPTDVIMFGRESAGVPDEVHDCADHRLIIPMQPDQRSLNLAVSAAMIAGEVLRQLDLFAKHAPTLA